MKIRDILESLSPIERKIISFLNERTLASLVKKSGVDETSALRALKYLENKGIIRLDVKKIKIVELGDNGVIYIKNGLPERRLLNVLLEKPLPLGQGKRLSRLSEDEFKAALGALKKKAMIDVKDGKIILLARMSEIIKKMLEEQLIESLGKSSLYLQELQPEQLHAVDSLKSRKDIIRVREVREVRIKLSELGREIMGLVDVKRENIRESIEQLTPTIIKSGTWRGKRFRRYDLKSGVPAIFGGKRHFVNQAIEYARKIWLEMGFKEMIGSLTQTAFWNFDALFQPQDHPVREMQDTFYIKDAIGKLPNKSLVEEVKRAHEKGVNGSKGWQYLWNEKEARKVILRTHTTCLSAQTLYKLSKFKDKKGKFFAIGRNFRNETLDWSHGFEFNQTEGIVVDKDANFRHLFGYLKEFFRKMGIEKIRFAPAYFPYTEPSVEISAWNAEKGVWLELGGAGMFRPEVIIPLLGEYIPVLAWGPGFDRMIMDYYGIGDLREFYENDLNKLRKMRFWLKS